MIKRAVDLAIAVPVAIVTAPLVALLAVALRLESRGDPIYRQTRVGRNGRKGHHSLCDDDGVMVPWRLSVVDHIGSRDAAINRV